ncbi:hypothetical protein ACYSNW_04860 [Enterococcus sp. LJL99]
MIESMFSEIDDYKILAIPKTDGFSFMGGLDNGETTAVEQDENGETIKEYNLSIDPRATTIKEAKELINRIKEERLTEN